MTQSTRTMTSEGAADLSREGVDGIALVLRQLLELHDDNVQLTGFLRAAHELCGSFNDVATTERHTWFLDEVVGEV